MIRMKYFREQFGDAALLPLARSVDLLALDSRKELRLAVEQHTELCLAFRLRIGELLADAARLLEAPLLEMVVQEVEVGARLGLHATFVLAAHALLALLQLLLLEMARPLLACLAVGAQARHVALREPPPHPPLDHHYLLETLQTAHEPLRNCTFIRAPTSGATRIDIT